MEFNLVYFYFFLDHGSHIHMSRDAAGKSHAQSDSAEEHLNIGILKHQVSKVEPDVFIGLSLCCGFVFMLLIDHISGGHSHAPSGTGRELEAHSF